MKRVRGSRFAVGGLAFAAGFLPLAAYAQAIPTTNPNGRMPATRHPISTGAPPQHLTIQDQMRIAREQRAAATAQRMGLGASIRAHLQAEKQERLARENGVKTQAENDRIRVQQEARQDSLQVQTRHAGGIHVTDPALDWRGIATTSGQTNASELAAQDPTLTFDGRAGEPYPVSQALADRTSKDDAARVRATFFAKPYFIRDGVRYQRTTIYVGATRYYLFVRR